MILKWVVKNCRFAKLIATSALRMRIGQDRGNSVAVISGDHFLDTYSIKDQLYQIGFYWNRAEKSWMRNLESLQKDTNALETLRSLGIPVDQFAAPMTPARSRPAVTPQPAPTSNWVLAENIGDPEFPMGMLYVLRRNQDGGWDYQTEDGRQGIFKDDKEAKLKVQSIKENGKPILGNDPQSLMAGYRNKGTEEPAPKVLGRIPEERISDHQKAVQETFLDTDNNIMLSALAGTGKTTMLRHLASYKDPKQKWLYLVFNKKNQVEASSGKGKFPGGVEVLTSHSFLGKVLGSTADAEGMPRTELWDQKGERLPRILDDILEHDDVFPRALLYAAKKTIKQLASLAKANAIVPSSPDAEAQLRNIIEQYQIDTDLSTEKYVSDRNWAPQIIEKTLEALHYSLPENGRGEYAGKRDHDDTLWYAATQKGISWPRYDVVLADEVQDFNKCQTIMLQKLQEAGARIVAVGDENQSLYLFRGADANAFGNVEKVVSQGDRGGTTQSLPVNYRSGRKIIEYVRDNTHVKDLQAGVKHEGQVMEGTDYDRAMDGLAQEWTGVGKLRDQTAFIARTNRPLVDAALDLLQNNMDFQIIGRDFSQELIQVIEKITGKGWRASHFPISDFPARMQAHVEDLEKKWKGKISKADELSELRDVSQSLNNVVDYLASMDYNDQKLKMRVRDTRDFIDYLRKKFSGVDTNTVSGSSQYDKKDPDSFVTLTTAHRSKGLEFNRVYILEPNLFPHPNAKTPEALKQEENAWYVALTRAVRELHVMEPKPDRRLASWVANNCKFAMDSKGVE